MSGIKHSAFSSYLSIIIVCIIHTIIVDRYELKALLLKGVCLIMSVTKQCMIHIIIMDRYNIYIYIYMYDLNAHLHHLMFETVHIHTYI